MFSWVLSASLMLSAATISLGSSPQPATFSTRLSQKTLPSKPSSTSSLGNLGWASSNWSGYALASAVPGTYHQVSGQWIVPTVSGHKSSASASWIGIDGFNNANLIQTGTEQDIVHGHAQYYAWWEILPASETPIAMAVSPGDVMSASIAQVSSTQWTIRITNKTTGQVFSTTQTYTGPGQSAEWIVEAPTIGSHIASLASYGTTTFDQTSVNGMNPGLMTREGGYMIQHHHVVSVPSRPDGERDGFNIRYGTTMPPAPSGS